MADQTMRNVLIGGVVLIILWNMGFLDGILGNQSATPEQPSSTIPGGCGVEPSVELLVENKYDASITSVSNTHRYKKNGGSTRTYSAVVDAVKGDMFEIMFGSGNTTYFNELETKEVTKCGLNTFQTNLVQNGSVTIECFDENNDIINDVADNYTIGSGESATIDCRIKMDSNKQGFPHGGVLYVELASGTVYAEENTQVNGGLIGGRNSGAESAYTLSAAANKVVAFDVNGLETTGYNSFTVYVEAEDGQNPGITNDVTLTLYPKDFYENGDTGEFAMDVVDEDNSFLRAAQATETISID